MQQQHQSFRVWWFITCRIALMVAFLVGVVFVDERFKTTNWQVLTVSQRQTLTMFTTMNMKAYQRQTWSMFFTQPFMLCMLCLRHLWGYEPCTVAIHFHIVETFVLKPKQNPLPVVLLPKKEANKYSDNLYSISVTLLYLEFWIRRPDHTPLLFIMNAYLCLKKWK